MSVFSVDNEKQPPYEEVRKNHQVLNPAINTFTDILAFATFEYCTAHCALSFNQNRAQKKDQKNYGHSEIHAMRNKVKSLYKPLLRKWQHKARSEMQFSQFSYASQNPWLLP